MSKINWGLTGVYDIQTFSYLQQRGIKQFAFDFRPRSMNFLQHHRFFEILEECYQGEHRYFLHFENEKDFVIKKFLQDISNFLDDDLLKNQFFLFFTDDQSSAYYEQFRVPFYWQYQENSRLADLIKGPYFKGPVVPYVLMETLFYEGTLPGFFQHLSTYLLNGRLPVIIYGNWQMEIIPDIFHYKAVESFWLPLDREIEKSYRTIDFIKIENYWKRFQNLESLERPLLHRFHL